MHLICNFGSNPHLSSLTTVPSAIGGQPTGQEGKHLIHHDSDTTSGYDFYHQQYRKIQRQHSSPMASRQLPMAPFGHRRTASSGSFDIFQEQSSGKLLCCAIKMQHHYYIDRVTSTKHEVLL